MNYAYLSQNEELILTISTWVFNEWGKHNSESTLEKVVTAFTARAESKVMPLTIVAFDDQGNPVGTASLTVNDMKSHPELTPWLGSVFIAPEARGKGIASELCRRIETEAKRLGHSRLYLFTDSAQKLYAKMGWTHKADEVYRDLNVSIMELDLSL